MIYNNHVMIEISKISKESLSNLGIYELRELARQVGVKSPTTKLRSELCDTILKIKSGEIQPNVVNLKKGRPPKSINKSITIQSADEPYDVSSIKPSKFETLNQSIRPNFFSNQVRVEGCLIEVNNKLYFYNNQLSLDSLTLIEMPPEYVAIYELRQGDKIVAICDNSNVDNYIVKKVLTINNVEIENLPEVRNNFDVNKAILTNKTTTIFERYVNVGSTNLFNFKNESDFVDSVVSSKNDFVNVVVGGELMPKDLFVLQGSTNLNCFVARYGEDLRLIYNNIVNTLNFAESMLKDGKKVVIYILNPLSLVKTLDMYYSSKEKTNFSSSPNSIQLIKRILGSARAISDEMFLNVEYVEIGEANVESEKLKKELNLK